MRPSHTGLLYASSALLLRCAPGCKLAVRPVLAALLSAAPALAQQPGDGLSVRILPLSEIKVGMIGEADAVFQGTRTEKMGVEDWEFCGTWQGREAARNTRAWLLE